VSYRGISKLPEGLHLAFSKRHLVGPLVKPKKDARMLWLRVVELDTKSSGGYFSRAPTTSES
jgi:hypothetical protein